MFSIYKENDLNCFGLVKTKAQFVQWVKERGGEYKNVITRKDKFAVRLEAKIHGSYFTATKVK